MKKVLLIALAAAVVSAVVFAAAERRPAGVVTGENLLLTEPRFKTQIKTGGALAGGPKSMPTTAQEGGERPLDAGNISSYAIKDDILPIEVVTPKEMVLRAALWIVGIAGALLALFAAAALYLGREKKVTPPDVEALVALRGLNADVHEGKIGAKEFYSRLVPILASYFIARFSLERSEMTKTEILASLENIPEAEGKVRETAARILSAAESTRYFDGSAGKDEMIRDIESVKEIIAATRPAPKEK